jgi:hypothetical protein
MQSRRYGRQRSCVPLWAKDDAKVRVVIHERIRRYCAAQGIHVPKDADAAQLSALSLAARKIFAANGDKLVPDCFQILLIKKHLDATAHGVPGYLARLVYCAYRLRMTSTQISEETDRVVSPVAVRQSLHRLNRAAWIFADYLADREPRRTRVPSDLDTACKSLLRNEALTDEELNLEKQRNCGLWETLQCDGIESGRVATLFFGFAMHVGATEAVKTLQQVAGVKRDGVMNDATLGQINSGRDRSISKALLAAIEARYRQLATRSDETAKIVKAWLAQLECTQSNVAKSAEYAAK